MNISKLLLTDEEIAAGWRVEVDEVDEDMVRLYKLIATFSSSTCTVAAIREEMLVLVIAS